MSEIGNFDPNNFKLDAAPAEFLAGGNSERSDNVEQFDANIHSGIDKRNADGSYRRKRGRKAGVSKSNSTNDGVTALTRALSIVHVGLASVTKSPELELEDKEALILSQSIANVMDEFDIKPDPKIEAILGLVTSCTMIYGPRLYLIRERKKSEAKDD